MTTDHENTPSGPDSAAPDLLAGIAAEAAALESGAAAPVNAAVQAAEAQQAAQVADEARAIAGLALTLGLPLLAAWKPQYAAVYGEPQKAAIADAFANLAQSQGWNLGDTIGRYGPWLAFGAAVAGPVLPVVMAELSEAKKPDQPAAIPAAPAPAEPEPAPEARGLEGQRVL